MNLLITTRCNHNCKYCFIDHNKESDMDIEQIRYITSFPDFSDLNKVSILGGEPTLHSQLSEIISTIRSANLNTAIQLFSHCGNDILNFREINDSNLILIANCYENRNSQVVKENLKIARQKGWTIALSYTIASKNLNIDDVLEFCEAQDIRIVRWSLAMPAYGSRNIFVTKDEYKDYLHLVEKFCKSLLQNRIISYNDCPIPKCMIEDSALSENRSAYVKGVRCGTCNPPYDIHPDYSVTGCMGIGDRIKFDLRDFNTIKEMTTFYEQKVNQLRIERQLSQECKQCSLCDGGCFGFDL